VWHLGADLVPFSMRNWFCLALAILAFAESAFAQSFRAQVEQADAEAKAKMYQEATSAYESAFRIGPANSDDFYNGACAAALAGNQSLAFEWLRLAIKLGAAGPKHPQKDADLASLHDSPIWKEIVAGMQKNRDAIDAKVDKPLKAELEEILADDQKLRNQVETVQKTYGRGSPQEQALFKAMGVQDDVDLAKVEAILDKRGWLGPDVVGGQGNEALFLVIQHADLPVQEKYLPMMRAAVEVNNAQPSSLALLEDRVALREGRPQTYGSQIGFNKATGKSYVLPLADPDNADARRNAAGLEPLAEYVKYWNITWDLAEYKKELPELIKLGYW
jgi:hypothetical protein